MIGMMDPATKIVAVVSALAATALVVAVIRRATRR